MSALIALALALQQPVTTDQDYKETLAMLHVTSMRMWADGNNWSAPNAANKDEAKADAYTNYPALLKFKDGSPVATKDDWTKRRAEIVEDFDREVYGRVPADLPKVTWEVTKTEATKEGPYDVVRKTLVGHVDNSAYPAIKVDIPLTLTLPATAKKPVPVIMEFGFGFFNFKPRPGMPVPKDTPWQQQVLARGYGYAVLVPTAVQADNGAGLRAGIIGLVNKGGLRKPDDWGALRAWAWGASRALDYLETDSAVDAKKVAIEGISRYGKASVVTMAYDQRFAAAFVGSSGSGGAKLWRRDFGERETNLASSGEYHWMTPNFIKYGGPMTPGDLPIDQHELIALCAPRPVFVGCGSPNVEGYWVDDKGMFLGTAMASPAWELLGAKGLGATEMPPITQGLTSGDLAFRQHDGGHTNGPNWPTFLDWVSRYFG